jgi:hypothetical protein
LLVAPIVCDAGLEEDARALMEQQVQAHAFASEAHRATAEIALASITIGDAWGGDADAFGQLRGRCDAVAGVPRRLAAALPREQAPGQDELLRSRLEDVARKLASWAQDCARIADLGPPALVAHETRQALDDAALPIGMLLDQVVRRLSDEDGSAKQVYVLMRQLVILDRIRTRVRAVLAAGPDAIVAQDTIKRDTMIFVRVLDALIAGDAELGIAAIENADSAGDLREVRENFTPVADRLLSMSDELDIVDAGDLRAELAYTRDVLVDDLRALAVQASRGGE